MDSAQETIFRQQLSDEAQRIAIDAEYTGRQHQMVGQEWRAKAKFLGLPVTLLAAITGTGAGLSALLGGEAGLTAVLAFTGVVLGAIQGYFKPEDQAAKHSVKGAKCIAIRNDARRFRNLDLNSDKSLDALSERIQTLGRQYDDLRVAEPREIPKGVYEKVKSQIAAGNYTYENDPLWQKDGG